MDRRSHREGASGSEQRDRSDASLAAGIPFACDAKNAVASRRNLALATIAAAPVRVMVKNRPRGLSGVSGLTEASQKPHHFAVLGRGVLLIFLVLLFWGVVGAIWAEFTQHA